jgi:hypothetical protein
MYRRRDKQSQLSEPTSKSRLGGGSDVAVFHETSSQTRNAGNMARVLGLVIASPLTLHHIYTLMNT